MVDLNADPRRWSSREQLCHEVVGSRGKSQGTDFWVSGRRGEEVEITAVGHTANVGVDVRRPIPVQREGVVTGSRDDYPINLVYRGALSEEISREGRSVIQSCRPIKCWYGNGRRRCSTSGTW